MVNETYLFTDKETTGFAKSGGLIQDGQARVCQSAMILTDGRGKIISRFSTLIKPTDWEIGAGAFKVHGIPQSDCIKYGMDQYAFVSMFSILTANVTKIVAHNSRFDSGMMDIEYAYAEIKNPNKPWYCTMKNNAHLQGGKSLKNCVRHYLGRDTSKAHDAMGDTIDCMEVFFAMRGIKINQ